MYFVNITEIAEEDIFSAINYIAFVLNAPIAANNLLDEIEQNEKKLENTPSMFPFVSDEYLARNRVKYVFVKNYILFYTINEEEKTVTVLRFLYGRRDWKNILKHCFLDY